MTAPEDQDLRDRFAALRREDAAAAPPFDAVRASAVRPPSRRPRLARWAPAITVAAAAVLVALGVLRMRQPREPLVSLATTRWQSPTDFLLRVPGAEYLEGVPRLSSWIPQTTDWRNP